MNNNALGKRIMILLIACAAVAALFVAFYRSAGRESTQDAARSIEETIRERALQCYVIEGAYPVDLEYLEENYGLTLNRKDYLVVYDIFAENLPPDVRVIRREKRTGES